MPKEEIVRGDWKVLDSEKFHILYFSPNIIMIIKSRRMIWAGHVAPEERRPLKRLNCEF
jgi:hypothetical protein